MRIHNSHALIFFVGCLIILPQLLSPFCSVKTDFAKQENRNITPFPSKFKYKRFPMQLEEYYNDRIPFRYWLLPLAKDVGKQLFPSHSTLSIVGRNGFLFYTNPQSRECPFLQYIGKYSSPITQHDRKLILGYIRAAQDHARKNHAQFLAVIAPNKIDIYPDMLPEKRKFKQQGFLIEDLVSMAQRSRPQVELLYLKSVLTHYRNLMTCPLYFAQDTHWNYAGAYCAFKAILERLNAPWPESWPLPEKAIPDLSQNRLNANDMLRRAPSSVARVKESDCRIAVPHMVCRQLPNTLVTENPHAFDQREVLVFRDSFFIALFPYFSAYFRKVHYHHGEYDAALVEKLNPQLVIFERIARSVPFFYRRKIR